MERHHEGRTATLEENLMGRDEVEDLREQLEKLTETVQELVKSNVYLSTLLTESCKALDEMKHLVGVHQTDITTMKGKIGVGQWLLMTVGTVVIGAMVTGIWLIAFKV